MDNKKKPCITSQEKIEELSDSQLSQVNGGITIPTTSSNENLSRLKLGQAVKKPSCFPNSGRRSK